VVSDLLGTLDAVVSDDVVEVVAEVVCITVDV
jgi:hypothetical protein